MSDTPNLHLTAWDRGDDPYNHSQLSANMYKIDAHDHTSGNGKQIVTAALADSAVATVKIGDRQVTRAKLADLCVGPSQLDTQAVVTNTIADHSVTRIKLADGSVGAAQIDPNLVPIGQVIPWWRPSSSQPIPTGWVVADGSSLTSANHDFASGGTIVLPDLRNKFILGADTGGTGTGTSTPPAIGQTGGSNSANLAHTHNVSHSHTVGAHSHSVQPHAHTLKPHTHGVAAHSHTVDAHDHLVPSHTHPVADHTHGMLHTHNIAGHSHGINAGGSHTHVFDGASLIVGLRNIQDNPNGTPLHAVAAPPRTSGQVAIADNGVHNHGGLTDGSGTLTTGNGTRGNTDAASSTATGNAAFNTGTRAPNTSAVPLTTQAQNITVGEGTENTSVDTFNSTAFATSTDNPTTTSALTSTDIRPSFVGLLYLIKVKNS